MKIKTLIISIIVSLSACGVIGKKKDDDTTTRNLLLAVALSNTSTTINFGLDSGSLKNVSSTGYVSSDTVLVSGGSQVSLKDARFFIHDINFIKTDGTKVAFSMNKDGVYQNSYTANGKTYNVGLLDFADSSELFPAAKTTNTINTKITGSGVSGSFSGIEFTVGVPEDLNHLDDTTLPAPLNSPGMYWSWELGFKFMKLELQNGASSSNYISWHNGSSGCNNRVCTYKNRATITVTKSSGTFNPSTDTVALDIQALVNGTNTTASAVGCMAGPQTSNNCGIIGNNMGLVKATGLSSGSQTAFTIR